MSKVAWALFATWLFIALLISFVRGWAAFKAGNGALTISRLKNPVVYLFAGYLLIAALVLPLSEGESTSPLLWLALAFPTVFIAGAFGSAGHPETKGVLRLALAALYGGALFACAAMILALVSPAFVPIWLR